MALKMHGPQTAPALGERLSITGEAVRQQLVRLSDEGLVDARSEARGVGRPSQVWELTPAGNDQFPDTHAELTVQLLRTIRATLGEPALDTIIAAREQEIRSHYKAQLEPLPDWRERVDCLARIRAAEGYMADWQEAPDGSLLLVENHCPICAAATACQGFCRSELDIFRSVLGTGVQVERVEHILSGARRCAYRITQADAAAPTT
ncbi:helix-turn-helix transcriptional regulator [Kaistia granuli]|uniref:helix-turn-helix transcriptional regulator n=1 Tax=Kaistia granuli TaxID=363259 RepID=UPI00036E3042|nr:metalloregulator ArsR/SmtB family transcription factor [Kaistia granuli]